MELMKNIEPLFKIVVIVCLFIFLSLFADLVNKISEPVESEQRFQFIGNGLTLDSKTGAIYSMEMDTTRRRFDTENEYILYVSPIPGD